MKQPPKYILMHAKDLSVPPGDRVWIVRDGKPRNTEMIELTSLWQAIKYIARTKAARAAVLAGRFNWIRVKGAS